MDDVSPDGTPLEESLRCAAQGDRDALNQLLLLAWPVVEGYTRSLLSGDGCDEVVQESLRSLQRVVEKYSGQSKQEFKRRVFQIVRWRKDDYLRRKYGREKTEGVPHDPSDLDQRCADVRQQQPSQADAEANWDSLQVDWERKEIEARAFIERFMDEQLQWTDEYTPIQRVIRAALLRHCGGPKTRAKVRKDPEVVALKLSKRTLEKLIPEAWALLCEEKERQEMAAIYYCLRATPDLTNAELRAREELRHQTDWDFRQRKARLKRLERRAEDEVKRRFFGAADDGSGEEDLE